MQKSNHKEHCWKQDKWGYEHKSETGNSENEGSKVRCRSILDFNLLLIHTLRILLKQKGKQEDIQKPFDKKNLIGIFDELEDKDTKDFFNLLWRVRYLFDQYVVKWRYDNESDSYADEDEKLRLTSLSPPSQENESSWARQKMSILQSVLYFTGGYNQQYWLTPFLYFLLEENDGLSDEIALTELEKIDNVMLPGEKGKFLEAYE